MKLRAEDRRLLARRQVACDRATRIRTERVEAGLCTRCATPRTAEDGPAQCRHCREAHRTRRQEIRAMDRASDPRGRATPSPAKSPEECLEMDLRVCHALGKRHGERLEDAARRVLCDSVDPRLLTVAHRLLSPPELPPWTRMRRAAEALVEVSRPRRQAPNGACPRADPEQGTHRAPGGPPRSP